MLLVDMDPQANLTSGVGLKGQTAPAGTIYQALTGDGADPPLRPRHARPPDSRSIPADRNLTGAEIELVSLPTASIACARSSIRSATRFDYIFIDTPPSLGLLTLNALVAADAVLIPLNCEYFALEGLADLVATLRRVRAALNPSLDIAGVLLTMYDERTNLGQQVARDIRAFFQERVYNTVIPRNIRLGEAPSHGMPAILYDAKSRGAEAYLALAREVLARDARRPGRHGAPPWLKNDPPSAAACPRSFPTRRRRAASGERALDVDTDLLRPNKFQPRTPMDEGQIDELARSIRANGMIQPIVVRKVDGGFEIVAGERRWRASQRAGLLKVPVVVRDIPEDRLLAAALIENIQREDLNPIEEAHAYRRLADEYHLTQEQIAEAVSKDRSSIANYLRLLRSPASSCCVGLVTDAFNCSWLGSGSAWRSRTPPRCTARSSPTPIRSGPGADHAWPRWAVASSAC